MNFGRTTQHQCWTQRENLVAKGTSLGGRPWGLRGCCFFLETAKTMELQKFQNEDDKQSGLV